MSSNSIDLPCHECGIPVELIRGHPLEDPWVWRHMSPPDTPHEPDPIHHESEI